MAVQDAVADLANGEKMIVSAHSGGVLIPDSFIDKRQHMKALREAHAELKDFHRWRFVPAGGDLFTIQHAGTGRFVEPLRRSEDSAVYQNVRYQGPILLETGPLPEARDKWQLRHRDGYYQIALRDTSLVMGLTHPDHSDSWITLLDPWWSLDRLWLIHDVPDPT